MRVFPGRKLDVAAPRQTMSSVANGWQRRQRPTISLRLVLVATIVVAIEGVPKIKVNFFFG